MNKSYLIEEAGILNVASFICWTLAHWIGWPALAYVSLAMVGIAFLMTLTHAVKLSQGEQDAAERRKTVIHIVNALVFQVVFVACFCLFN